MNRKQLALEHITEEYHNCYYNLKYNGFGYGRYCFWKCGICDYIIARKPKWRPPKYKYKRQLKLEKWFD